MQRIALKSGADQEGFRRAVRALLAQRLSPDRVIWDIGGTDSLFEALELGEAPPVSLPRRVLSLVQLVACHRDPEKYALLYTLIWRLLHGEPHLLEVHSDALVQNLEMKYKTIRRDLHKMHAFLRFRRVEDGGAERFVAWFEPDHFILQEAAAFFVDRFRSLTWSILTPVGSLHWDRSSLTVGPPAHREDAPGDDPFESSWNAYYESTFNPARLNTELMRAHMPKKYWRNMPETYAIGSLVQSAPSRAQEMYEREAAVPRKRNPDKALDAMKNAEPKSLSALNTIIAAAEPMVPGATRAVLGEGPVNAAIAFVGEQPGDVEDQQGRPFVGPAGQLLDRAMAQAGIDRTSSYLTNAVKHFKFEQRGKRRIHQKPTAGEVKHYRWWLEKELELVHPRLIVALGATAALALSGKPLPIMRSRGPADFNGQQGFITVHPSYLLRLRDPRERERAFSSFVADLKAAKALASKLAA